MKRKVDCPFGVVIFPEAAPNRPRTVSYPDYTCVILRYAGVCYRQIQTDDLVDNLHGLKILLTVGDHLFDKAAVAEIDKWVRSGGSWISVAGTCGLADTLGVREVRPAYRGWGIGDSVQLGEGYLSARSNDSAPLAHLSVPLHFFNGLAAEQAGATVLADVLDPHQRVTPRIAFAHHLVGTGEAYFIGADIPGTVVRIQQGISITRDGVPTGDGTAPLCDMVLKTDDGCTLDRYFDRESVGAIPGLCAYLCPVADQWREVLLRTVFACASRLDLALPVLWLYPRQLPAIAHISHDTDENDPSCAKKMVDVLSKHNIRTTWCTIVPGYTASLTSQIAEAGHELAMHYDAVSDDWSWSHENFLKQHDELTKLFGHRPVTNKNHFLRWEGDTEFFEWCVGVGIEMDQSKGPSKPGVAGFLFGTCHPYFPVDPKGKLLDILELPTLAQDLAVFIPTAFLEPLFSAVLGCHGVLHLLFHPAHIMKPGVTEAIQEVNRLVEEAGMEWWTAEEINAWHRGRMSMKWGEWENHEDGVRVGFHTEASISDATYMLLGTDQVPGVGEGISSAPSLIKCWGFEFTAIELSLEAGDSGFLTIDNSHTSKRANLKVATDHASLMD